MKVNILFKNKNIKSYTNVKMVSNVSTTITNDFIYIYRIGDIIGEPSIIVPVNDIICIETMEDWYEPEW